MAQHVLHIKLFKEQFTELTDNLSCISNRNFIFHSLCKLSIAQTFFVREKCYKIGKMFATLRFITEPLWKCSLGNQEMIIRHQ